MKLLDVIKRAILEGKLDTELGITDGDVVKRFDKVMELIDKPIQLPRFELPKLNDNPYKDYCEKYGHKIWSANPIVMGKVEDIEDGTV